MSASDGHMIPIDPPTQRAATTISCRDAESIPKVHDAGRIRHTDGETGPAQVMHNGLLVRYGGYYGDWMANIIHGLRGHHEPQEERCFDEVLRYCRPRTTILELGAFWSYYSMWFLHSVPMAKACCVEPDPDHLRVGVENMRMNRLHAEFSQAAVGSAFVEEVDFETESGKVVRIAQHDAPSAMKHFGLEQVELLHADIQGRELDFLQSGATLFEEGRVRFVFASTHHASISGSTTTHRDCCDLLRSFGAHILCEHDVDESFSGDGLVVAAMRPEDRGIPAIEISRCRRRQSLFPNGY